MEPARVKLSECPWMYCDCGGTIFTEKMMYKKVSKILTAGPEDQQVPIPVLICHDCNKVPSFIHSQIPGFPEENKAKPKFNLNAGVTSAGG